MEIYQLFIRSCAEYCAVAFHSSLTQAESKSLERLQSTCLKVILQDDYISYASALERTGLQTLYDGREERWLNFSIKCIKHPLNSHYFPLNPSLQNNVDIREREQFYVNFAKTEDYRNSAIPYCQRLLNTHFKSKPLPAKTKSTFKVLE